MLIFSCLLGKLRVSKAELSCPKLPVLAPKVKIAAKPSRQSIEGVRRLGTDALKKIRGAVAQTSREAMGELCVDYIAEVPFNLSPFLS